MPNFGYQVLGFGSGVEATPVAVDVLVVAGGGAGGTHWMSGGGGAGGFRTFTEVELGVGNYTITVGGVVQPLQAVQVKETMEMTQQ